jgi:hypothetical protein
MARQLAGICINDSTIGRVLVAFGEALLRFLEKPTSVLTGVTNAKSEALNRLAKLEARMAYSFRNPANQRRRVQIACTRTARRSRAVTPRRSRQLP